MLSAENLENVDFVMLSPKKLQELNFETEDADDADFQVQELVQEEDDEEEEHDDEEEEDVSDDEIKDIVLETMSLQSSTLRSGRGMETYRDTVMDSTMKEFKETDDEEDQEFEEVPEPEESSEDEDYNEEEIEEEELIHVVRGADFIQDEKFFAAKILRGGKEMAQDPLMDEVTRKIMGMMEMDQEEEM